MKKILLILGFIMCMFGTAVAKDDDDQTGQPPWIPNPIDQEGCHLSGCGAGDIGSPWGSYDMWGTNYGGWANAYPCETNSFGIIIWDTCNFGSGNIPGYACEVWGTQIDYSTCYWTSAPWSCVSASGQCVSPPGETYQDGYYLGSRSVHCRQETVRLDDGSTSRNWVCWEEPNH